MELAASKLLENKGSVGAAMREAGYTESYARNPQLMTKSEEWQVLLDKYIPDELLAKEHVVLIKADDLSAKARGIDLGYKVKDKYPAEKNKSVVQIIGEQPQSEPVMDAVRQEFEEKLRLAMAQ